MPPATTEPFLERNECRKRKPFRIATKLEAEDHKKELTMAVSVCDHMLDVNNIAWLGRNKARDRSEATWRTLQPTA